MPNSIKSNGDGGYALQVTKEARAAGLVEENADGDAKRLASVRVYAFDGVLLVVDSGRVGERDIVGLVTAAARDTESIYRAMNAAVSIAGNGYQTQLPVAEDAGLEIGDTAPCQPAPDLLVIHSQESAPARLAADLVEIRRSQVEG